MKDRNTSKPSTIRFVLALTYILGGGGAGLVTGWLMARPTEGSRFLIASYHNPGQGTAFVYGKNGGLIDGWSYRFAFLPANGTVWREYYLAHEETGMWKEVQISGDNGVLYIDRQGDRVGEYNMEAQVFDNVLRRIRYTEPLQNSPGLLRK